MTAISGTIITFNEEDHIEACIASLKMICDEIVVVDSLSTDRTRELAEAAGAGWSCRNIWAKASSEM